MNERLDNNIIDQLFDNTNVIFFLVFFIKQILCPLTSCLPFYSSILFKCYYNFQNIQYIRYLKEYLVLVCMFMSKSLSFFICVYLSPSLLVCLRLFVSIQSLSLSAFVIVCDTILPVNKIHLKYIRVIIRHIIKKIYIRLYYRFTYSYIQIISIHKQE